MKEKILAQMDVWTPAQVRACATIARYLGHGWATDAAHEAVIEAGLPLCPTTVQAAYMVAWNECLSSMEERQRSLYVGALGPGIGSPDQIRLDSHFSYQIRVGERGLSGPGGRTATGRLNWVAVTRGRLVLWVERSIPGQESLGAKGTSVLSAEIRENSEDVSVYILGDTDLAEDRHYACLYSAIRALTERPITLWFPEYGNREVPESEIQSLIQ